jgi:hypothetical protein
MKFVMRRTPLGFETYLWVEGALADLRDLMSQLEVRHPLALRPVPRPHRVTTFRVPVVSVTSDEKLSAVQ